MTVKFPAEASGARPVPRPYAYPSDYGLATAITHLLSEYGKIGAINRLIEAAEMLERDVDPLREVLSRRRVEPNHYAAAKHLGRQP